MPSGCLAASSSLRNTPTPSATSRCWATPSPNRTAQVSASPPSTAALAKIAANHQGRWNADPQRHPIRILIATDAARENVNLQNNCADLFHFDIPWNPSRIEQRNGRIDRKLQQSPVVRCMYFGCCRSAEDRVLDVIVSKTRTIQESWAAWHRLSGGALMKPWPWHCARAHRRADPYHSSGRHHLCGIDRSGKRPERAEPGQRARAFHRHRARQPWTRAHPAVGNGSRAGQRSARATGSSAS